MSVTITDPPNNGSFPDPGTTDWTAYVTIDSADPVDGILIDYDNDSQAYASDNPTCTGGPDADGLYTWKVPFDHDASIVTGHTLLVYCYDAETGDGASCTDSASQNGYGRTECKSPKEGAPAISSLDFTKTGTKVSVTVNLANQPAHVNGKIFLVLAKKSEPDIRKLVKRIHVYRAAAQDADTAAVTWKADFQVPDIDNPTWTHIHIVAVTCRHQGGGPQMKRVKSSHPAKERHHKDR